MSLPAAVSRELYPFASHYRAQGALKQHYLDEGRGPAVVMVHGNPTCRSTIATWCARCRAATA